MLAQPYVVFSTRVQPRCRACQAHGHSGRFDCSEFDPVSRIVLAATLSSCEAFTTRSYLCSTTQYPVKLVRHIRTELDAAHRASCLCNRRPVTIFFSIIIVCLRCGVNRVDRPPGRGTFVMCEELEVAICIVPHVCPASATDVPTKVSSTYCAVYGYHRALCALPRATSCGRVARSSGAAVAPCNRPARDMTGPYHSQRGLAAALTQYPRPWSGR